MTLSPCNFKFCVYAIFFFSFFYNPNHSLYAQNDSQDWEVNLKQLSFEEFHNLEWEAFQYENWKDLKELTRAHLSKARRENNDLELARAFYYCTTMEEPDLALAYADSIILATLHNSHPNFPTLGYALKGHIYYNSGNFQSALDNYLQAYSIALKKENIEQQREISLAIAGIRNINGQHYAAAELYTRSLKLLEKKGDLEGLNYQDYITLLYNLSLTHLRLSEVDSAKIYAQKGMENTFRVNDLREFQDFVLLDAQINYYNKDYEKAQDTLHKYVDSLSGTSQAIKLYYLGKIEGKIGSPEKAIAYFKEIDSIITITQDPFNEVKNVYQQLIIHSIVEDDKKKQVEYITKLISYDSILASGQENIMNMAMVAYDIPYLKHQKRKAEEQLIAKSRSMLFFGSLAGLSMLIGVFFYLRNRRMSSRLKLLIEGRNNKINSKPKDAKKHPASVPEDIRNDILNKLELFENSEGFLKKDLDMFSLAQELGTNTSYLSLIINHYKGMGFSSYIKNLRINSAINQLSKDPSLLIYNYQGLAEIFGFKTGESFSRAFYQQTGVFPSKYLEELKSRKSTRDL